MTETTYEQVTQAEDKNLDKDVEKTHAKVKQIKIFLAISRYYNGSYCSGKGKNNNKEVNNIMPGCFTEENFWCESNDA